METTWPKIYRRIWDPFKKFNEKIRKQKRSCGFLLEINICLFVCSTHNIFWVLVMAFFETLVQIYGEWEKEIEKWKAFSVNSVIGIEESDPRAPECAGEGWGSWEAVIWITPAGFCFPRSSEQIQYFSIVFKSNPRHTRIRIRSRCLLLSASIIVNTEQCCFCRNFMLSNIRFF